jgi:hypothetical protein
VFIVWSYRVIQEVFVCCRRLAKIPSSVPVVYLQVRTVDVTNRHL